MFGWICDLPLIFLTTHILFLERFDPHAIWADAPIGWDVDDSTTFPCIETMD